MTTTEQETDETKALLESRVATTALHRRVEELELNQVTPAMQAEFEMGKEQRDKLRQRIEELTAELEEERTSRIDLNNAALKLEAENRKIRDQCNRQEHGFAQRESELQRDIATERAARERAEKALLDSDGVPWQVCAEAAEKEVARLRRAERERDTAMARVKELEAAYKQEEQDCIEESDARVAGETALASARELLAQWLRSFPHLRSARLGVRTEEWLTSHPAPVAAPACGRSWCKPDNRCADCTPQCTVCGRWSGHCDCVVPAPVAAPCAGCTSARTAITEALRLYAGGHEHGDVLRAWLKEHPQIELGKTQAALATEREAQEQAEKRIEELTAELAQWKQALGGDSGPQTPAEVPVFLREAERVQGHVAALEISKLRTALATERAAREQAEKQLAHTEDLLRGTADSARNWEEMCEQAERERDTALARVKELESGVPKNYVHRAFFEQWVGVYETQAEAAETALASARELLESAGTGNALLWDRRRKAWLTSQEKP